MVWPALAIAKVWGTSGAALYVAFPPCEAVTVQLPAPVIVIVAPLVPPLVQLPVAPKLTVSPDEAVALTTNGGSPKVLPASAANVMVWVYLPNGQVTEFVDGRDATESFPPPLLVSFPS